MEGIYYSRQNYNQLKKKQYEEYVIRQNMYYIYMKRYYEEYVKNQNRYYLDRKKQYEEYVRKQNMYYRYIKKCYEEYVKNQNRYYLDKKKYYEEYAIRQNRYYLYKKKYYEEQHKRNEYVSGNKRKYDKYNTLQGEFLNSFKTDSIENKNINDDNIKNNSYESLEINIKESNLAFKKDNLAQYDNLENNNYTSIEDSSNEEYLEEDVNEFLEENSEEYLEENNEKHIEKNAEEYLEEYVKEFLEGNSEEYLEENDEKHIEKNAEKSLEEYAKESLEEDSEEFSEEYLKENAEDFLKENTEELLGEDYNTFVKEELDKESDILTEGLYVKFPVILAETNITIPIEATITLDQEAMEIKEIKKNLLLTESHLIPFSSSSVEPNSGILFIAGFIRNNIEYKTQTCTTDGTGDVCGAIRSCTVEVPFNFTTRITFLRSPIFIEKPTTRNEKPFVEPVKVTFIEVDIHKNPILGREAHTGQEVTQIIEKIIVNLTLKVLQKQQLKIAIEY